MTTRPIEAPPLELKKTINLPQTKFAQKANLPQTEPARLKKWSEMKLYERIREARAGAEVHPARWPTLRQRRYSSGNRAQQNSERLHRQVAHDDGLRRAVCSGI